MKLSVLYAAVVSLVAVVSIDCVSAEEPNGYKEYPGKVYSYLQCPYLNYYFGVTADECKMKCTSIGKCTAVNYYSFFRFCRLLACPSPVSEPERSSSIGTGYARVQESCTSLGGTHVAGQCLIFNDESKTWDQAKSSCEARGQRLAVLQNPVVVNTFLQNNYAGEYIWLGASDSAEEGNWVWINGMSAQAVWTSSHPNNDANQDCLAWGWLNNYDDGWCTHSTSYICEYVTVSDCDPACQNGGTCNEAGKCDCPPGWMGDACDIECGRVNRKNKIVNGTVTELHEYPWQVLQLGTSLCGGSLINDRWILTAAHCTPAGSQTVTLGNHLLDESESAEITINVLRFNDHPDYNPSTGDYDVSLLELETPLDLTSVGPHISPVCLPKAANPSQYDDVEAIVTGWGRTYSGGPISNVLLEANVKTMSNVECNSNYDGQILDSMICAAEPGKDACQGDSGGPLVTEVDGFYNLIGVVSWGYGCAHPEYPGVYARVTHILDWISSTTSKTK